jgi:hypothetical protein
VVGDLAVAQPEDYRQVYCLRCLAKYPVASFADHLKSYRLAAGLTVSALAAKAGMRVSAFAGPEPRRKDPTWATAATLLRALGVRLVYGATATE